MTTSVERTRMLREIVIPAFLGGLFGLTAATFLAVEYARRDELTIREGWIFFMGGPFAIMGATLLGWLLGRGMSRLKDWAKGAP